VSFAVVVAPLHLFVCSLIRSKDLADRLAQSLSSDRYVLTPFHQTSPFLSFVEQSKHEIDCLILESAPDLAETVEHLHKALALLPAIVLIPEGAVANPEQPIIYHEAEVQLELSPSAQIAGQIEPAIANFLKLAATCHLPTFPDHEAQTNLSMQQQRLSEKLKERLGYLGIYYKRDPQLFLRHLSAADKQEFLIELKQDYRAIVLNYFSTEGINQQIDALVTKAFFADLSVSQVLEIHMELMDIFAKQLKLEGRNEDILLDYRLTLIDVVAHLCEMYRRSIPREA
jgi:circadian clock protein KaiA